MRQIRYLAASLFLLFICAVPAAASEPDNAGWAPAYEQYILNGEYLTSAEPSFYKEGADSIRFGLYDLDKDGFPELVAYNGCPNMAGACNYLFTFKNGQLSYIGDAGYRGSVLQYYPTGNYSGLFCSDGNNGLIITSYYTMEDGKIAQEDVMEQDYNSSPIGGDPQIRSLTDKTDLYDMLQTEAPVTLQMFTPAEIRSLGWKELISRYPFVYVDSSGSAPASQTGAAPAGYNVPFYGVWCSASKDPADMQAVADDLIRNGYDARVLVTTDWTNLNTEMWYVVTAGLYASEAEASAALSGVRTLYSDAYIKYSGSFKGSSSSGSVSSGSAPAGYNAPFYGVWCSASKSYADMQAAAGQLSQYGLPSGIFVTTDWSNLNPEFWYVLSAGTYTSESAAYAALPQIQSVFPDAYVKYSGNYIGG